MSKPEFSWSQGLSATARKRRGVVAFPESAWGLRLSSRRYLQLPPSPQSTFTDRFLPSAAKCSTHSRASPSPSSRFLEPFRINLLQHLVVGVLGPPDVHFEGKAPRQAGRGFQPLHQVDTVRVFGELFSQLANGFLQGETQSCAIERHALASRFLDKRVDAREIQILRVFQCARRLLFSANSAAIENARGRGREDRRRIASLERALS